MQIAPSAYWRHAARQRNPALCSLRAKRDASLVHQVQRVWQANMRVYRADKLWRQLNREDWMRWSWATSRLPNSRPTTIDTALVMPRPPDLNQRASSIPGAIHPGFPR